MNVFNTDIQIDTNIDSDIDLYINILIDIDIFTYIDIEIIFTDVNCLQKNYNVTMLM